MKKVLLTTTALAFAGSAFAADVTGYVTQGYQSSKDKADVKTTGMWTESEAYLSGSKTASNGLTFGATYTVGLSGNAKSTGTSVSDHEPTNEDVSGTKASGGATKSVVSEIDEHKVTNGAQYSNVNAFVSGSFGRVDMGRHNAASRTHGADSAAVAGGVAANGYDHSSLNGRIKAENAMTYSSPSFNGLSVAASLTPMSKSSDSDKKAPVSYGVKYMGNAAGMGIGFGFGVNKPSGKEMKNNTAWNLSVSKGAFAGSFGMGTVKKGQQVVATSGSLKAYNTEDTKQTRFGVAYSAGKIGVGFSQLSQKFGEMKQTKRTMYAKYTVASGLTAYVQNLTTNGVNFLDGKKSSDLLVGTTISF